MSPSTFIALRFLKPAKSQRFISVLSLVSFLGIFVSVAAFLIIHSVMNGFSGYLRENLIGFHAHLVVQNTKNSVENAAIAKWLINQPETVFVTPVVEFGALVETPYQASSGATIRALDFENLSDNPRLSLYHFNPLDQHASGKGVFMGEELYKRLQLNYETGEVVSIILPFGDVGPTGELEPRFQEFKVAGIFSSGFYGDDSRYVLMDLAEGRKLAGQDASHWLVRLKNESQAGRFKSRFLNDWPEGSVSTWQEKNKRLFGALKLEKTGMLLLLTLVMMIASFNVVGLMVILAFSKTKQIAILKALGMPWSNVRPVFGKVGIILGMTGMFLGMIGGLGVVFFLKYRPLALPPAYYLDDLPVRLDLKILIYLILAVPLFCWLASLWPARRAMKFEPVEVLREG